MDSVSDMSFKSSGCPDTPCRTLTFTTDRIRTYTFYMRVTAQGTNNNIYTNQITVNVVCGPNSSTISANPATGTSRTKHLGGLDAWFEMTIIESNGFSDCRPQSVTYVVSSTDNSAVASLVDSANPTPVTGLIYRAVPANIHVAQTITFTLRI